MTRAFIFLFSEEISPTDFFKRFQKSNVGEFYIITRPIIIFGNLFGLMPLKNFTTNESLKLQFTWKCWNFFYSILIQLCIFTLFFTSFYKQFVFHFEFDKISK